MLENVYCTIKHIFTNDFKITKIIVLPAFCLKLHPRTSDVALTFSGQMSLLCVCLGKSVCSTLR